MGGQTIDFLSMSFLLSIPFLISAVIHIVEKLIERIEY